MEKSMVWGDNELAVFCCMILVLGVFGFMDFENNQGNNENAEYVSNSSDLMETWNHSMVRLGEGLKEQLDGSLTNPIRIIPLMLSAGLAFYLILKE